MPSGGTTLPVRPQQSGNNNIREAAGLKSPHDERVADGMFQAGYHGVVSCPHSCIMYMQRSF